MGLRNLIRRLTAGKGLTSGQRYQNCDEETPLPPAPADWIERFSDHGGPRDLFQEDELLPELPPLLSEQMDYFLDNPVKGTRRTRPKPRHARG